MKFFNKIKDYFKSLDGLGILNLIKWCLLGLAVICVIIVDKSLFSVTGVALAVFSILLWMCIIAFIVLAIIVHIKKKKAKKNKSY